MIATVIMRVDRALAGQPDELLTLGLFATAGLLIVIALAGPPVVKAAALTWAILP